MSAIQRKIWCDDDRHEEYEYFSDFNDWLDKEHSFFQEYIHDHTGLDN